MLLRKRRTDKIMTTEGTHNASRDSKSRKTADLECGMQKLHFENETARAKQQTYYSPSYRTELARRGYCVKETLGSGTYSKVKYAQSVRDGKDFAIKIIDKKRAPSDYQEKFLPRELDIWPRLCHPNLIKLHNYFEEGKRVYMVIEYAAKGDLLRYVQTNGAICEDLAKKWTLQICDAIKYLHEQNVSHRDLKLENCLLDSDDNVKICDFGFVKYQDMGSLSQTYCGSKSYAAPEILKGIPYQPKGADVWALGVVLYIMVTGRMPFDESKGNTGLLGEHRKLNFRWEKRKVTRDCINLIHSIFTYENSSRPSIDTVMKHKWFDSIKTTATQQDNLSKHVPEHFRRVKSEGSVPLRKK